MGPDQETVQYFEIFGCFDPATGKQSKTIRVDEDFLRELRASNAYQFYNAQTAAEAVLKPSRVYRGVRKNRFASAWGWCYVLVPESVRGEDGKPVRLEPGTLFTAFVGESGILYEWGEEKADPSDQQAPVGAAERFVEVVWPKKT